MQNPQSPSVTWKTAVALTNESEGKLCGITRHERPLLLKLNLQDRYKRVFPFK